MLKHSLYWLRSVVFRRRLERDMREEMDAHIERATERLMARGMTEPDARRAAEREFGNMVYLREEGRLARGTGGLDAIHADMRYAFRQFGRRRLATLTMVAVLAFGMSISTILFSFLHSYATAPPPGVPHADDMVRIRGSQMTAARGLGSRAATHEEMEQYMTLTDHFRMAGGWRDEYLPIGATGDDAAHDGVATFVTESYFDVVGVRPVLGRAPAPAEFTGESALVAVIGDVAWERLFARSPDVLGRTVVVYGVPLTVVGVAPPRFQGMSNLSEVKIWAPLPALPQVLPSAALDAEAYRVAARLQPGVTSAMASAAVHAVAQRMDAAPTYDDQERTLAADVVPLRAASGDVNWESDMWRMALVLGGLALVVLLVTCTNVSALLAGIAITRRREVAIRLSLGAGRPRIVRQLLTENVLLATLAATVALAIVYAVQRAALALIPVMPIGIGLSVPATLFTFGVALAVGLLFGLSPALHATRLAVAGALRDSSSAIAGAQARLQRGLVVAQIALTQPLAVIVAAMLMMIALLYQQEGLTRSADHIVALRMRPQAEASLTEATETMRRLRQRLEATPGIITAAPDTRYGGRLSGYTAHPQDRVRTGPEDGVRLEITHVPAGWFELVGTPLTLGSTFAASDTTSLEGPHPSPIVIGDELARRLWPGANPLGRRLQQAANVAQPGPVFTVVGVYDEASGDDVDEDGFEVFVPPAPAQLAAPALLVRTSTRAEPLFPAIRATVRAATPGMMLTGMRTFADMEDEERRTYVLTTSMLAVAGLLTLALTAIGLYAVVALSVGQRTNEIAVRMAIGARARAIVQGFVGQGVRLGAIGLVIGLPLSMLALSVVTSLADVGQSLSWTLVIAVASSGVLTVATAAAWMPAQRAAMVDPATVLRRE